jgi:hypothetical protein
VGYLYLFAPCVLCRKLFASNPDRVPSYENQPICRDCIERVNEIRRKEGHPEWPIFHDSYEPLEEGGEQRDDY